MRRDRDPHDSLFSADELLMSVALRLVVDLDVRQIEENLLAVDVVKLCYMEVRFERQFGKNSEQASMVASLRVAVIRLLNYTHSYPVDGSLQPLPHTPHGVAWILSARLFPSMRSVDAGKPDARLDAVPR